MSTVHPGDSHGMSEQHRTGRGINSGATVIHPHYTLGKMKISVLWMLVVMVYDNRHACSPTLVVVEIDR